MRSAIVDVTGAPIQRKASAYEGATQGNRAIGWSAPSIGPNRALATAGKTLTNRTRAGYRNAPLMRSAIDKNVTNEVGKGFTLLSTCDDRQFRDTVNQLWKEVSTQLDPWGDMNFGAILDLSVRARRMSGEVFIRRLRRRLNSGLAVPLQVEILEADFCPIGLNRRLKNGNRIIQGVEFRGKFKVAYWFYLSHPDDGFESADLSKLERVPTADVIHHYKQIRPSQVRAEPEISAALLKNHTFAEYDDTELVRKKNRSVFTGFFSRKEFDNDSWDFDPQTGKPLFDDVKTTDEPLSIQAGTVFRGNDGESFTPFDGDNTGQGYKDFMRWQSLQISAGANVPYALVTGDWSGLNDRLVRAFLNEYRRGIGFDQTNLSGFQVAYGIWRWVITTAITTGRLYAPDFAENPFQYLKLDIRPDAFKHLHPVQEIEARNKAVNSQLSNAEAEAAENGHDLDDNMVRNARSLRRWQDICEKEGVKGAVNATGIFGPAEDLDNE